MAAVIDLEKCNQCGTCSDRCPEDVIAENAEGVPFTKYPNECWYCGACMIDCPADAIHLQLPLFLRLVPKPYKQLSMVTKREYR